LYESRAICRYLAENYAAQGTPLMPTDVKEKALVEQAASVELANFLPALTKVGREARKQWVLPLFRVWNADRVGYRRESFPVNEAPLAQALSELAGKLDVYEAILAKQKFIGGNVHWPSPNIPEATPSDQSPDRNSRSPIYSTCMPHQSWQRRASIS
jgi:glutathione S-transferase